MDKPEEEIPVERPRYLTKEELRERLRLPENVHIGTGGGGTGLTVYVWFTGDNRIDTQAFQEIYFEHFKAFPSKYGKLPGSFRGVTPGENECWWEVELSTREDRIPNAQSFFDALDHNFRRILRYERRTKELAEEARANREAKEGNVSGWRRILGKFLPTKNKS